MKVKKKKSSQPRTMTLEQALPALRRGRSIRRRGWVSGWKITRVNALVYMVGPVTAKHNTPVSWHPYAECILANDWEVV